MKQSIHTLLILTGLTISQLPNAAATEVYTYRDKNGNVVFSDKPSANSKKHEVREIPIVPAFNVPPKEEVKPPEPVFSYTSLSIVTPRNEDHLQSGYAGNVQVSAVLSPALREQDTIVMLDNGAVIAEGRQSNFALQNLNRGEHQLQMQVRDSKGKVLISSNPVTLYVQRASTLNRGG
ncbi:MAG: hypothetical protein CMI08_00290 [Oceanospirillaceae bacterium]|uniref:DUF4124 domain-containing protein n=1 Tax=unclassified Thalassolituus TaxID=2624967 RepID=UPI000C4C8D01|nr:MULTISPECIES: DUF4124 domain-containing protein [unclassified Thalassolituus]MAX97638.1 hypothetical protein [Oceanospirillaceae bacterium]MBS52567.1 hypothetical protein [Oceanospirillaceae bacterium]|tara:strand:+ start:962 stop:1495 length:534 start_codon:yes stop_codon:yes gene_type:complete